MVCRSLKLGTVPNQNRTPSVMVVPKIDSDGGLQLFPVDLSVTPNRVFPSRCMAHDRDSLTKDCLESLTTNNGLAGYDLFSLIAGVAISLIRECECLLSK